MAGNMNVSMKLSLIDDVSGPVRKILSELNQLSTITKSLNGSDGSARTGSWDRERTAIRGVVSELGVLRSATASVSATSIAPTIAGYSQQRTAIQGVVSELGELRSATIRAAAPASASSIASYNEQRGAIQGVVTELAVLRSATAEASAPAFASSIASYNEQRAAIQGVVADLGMLRGATAEALTGSAAPIESTIAKLNEEKAAVEGVAAAMQRLAAAGAPAAGGSGRRPGDATNWGERPDWSQYWANKRAEMRPDGWSKASEGLDTGEEPRSPLIRETSRKPVVAPEGAGLVGTMVGFGEMASGYRLAKGSYEQGAEAQSIDASMAAAGISEAERDRINDAANRMSRDKGVFNRNTLAGLTKDARTILGSTDHAIEAMPTILDLATIVEAKRPGQGDKGVQQLLRGIEASGSTNSIEQFNKRAETIAKVTNAYGGTISLEDYGQFFVRAGSSGARLSEQFIGEHLPHVLQEMHGDSAGTMIRTLMRNTVDMRMDKAARDTMADYGLLDASKVDEKGHLQPDAFLHARELQEDPYLYANKYLKPAFAARQLDDTEEEQTLNRMFSNPNTARAMALFMRQSEIIEKDAALVRQAGGLATAPQLRSTDPNLATASLASQWQNFEAQAGGAIVPTITRFQNGLATSIGTINEVLSRVPGASTAAAGGIAAGVGYLGWKTTQQGISAAGRMIGLGGGAAGEGAAAGAGAAGAGAAGGEGAAAGAAGLTEGGGAAFGAATGATFIATAAAGIGAMVGGIYALEHTGPKLGPRGRTEPPSEHDTDAPGYWTSGRGGMPRQWVPTGRATSRRGPPLSSFSGRPAETQLSAFPTAASPSSSPVTNNNRTSITVNAPVNISATVQNTTPAAIGGAVRGAILKAVKAGSTAALHDGHETK